MREMTPISLVAFLYHSHSILPVHSLIFIMKLGIKGIVSRNPTGMA